MAQGLFTRTQHIQGLVQRAWNTPVGTYAGVFNYGQYLNLGGQAAFAFGTGDFTIEFWVKQNSTDANFAHTIYDGINTGVTAAVSVYLNGDNTVHYSNGTSDIATSAIAVGSWTHVACVRASGFTRLYINGAPSATTADTVNLSVGTSRPLIGAYGATPTAKLNADVSNLRVVKGTAVYTSSFTPPIAPLTAITNTQLLTLQNATIVDNSSNAFTIANTGSVTTGAAMPFTQLKTLAVDYLVVAGGGGGGSGGGGGGGAGGLLQGTVPVTAGSSITVTVGGGAGQDTSGSNSVFGTITAIGGGGGGSTGNAGLAGGSGGGGSYPAGRSGQAVFGQGNAGGAPYSQATSACGGGGGAGTAGISPTSSNLPGNGGAGIASAISGTITTYGGGGGGGGSGSGGDAGAGGGGQGSTGSHAVSSAGTVNTGGGGGGAYAGGASSGGSGIVIVSYPDIYAGAAAISGSPTVSTSGSGSLSLTSASSQYISYAQNSAFNLGSGDFTIELWFYANGTQSANCILASQRVNAGVYYGPWAFYSSGTSGSLVFYSSSNGSSFDVASGATIGTYANNTWNHAVICRSGSSIRCYLNGTLGSTTTTSATLVSGTSPIFIGMRAPGIDPYFNGYISNFRLVTGTAVYTTSSFTPPATPLSPISGTQLLLGTVSPNQYLDSSSNAFQATISGSGSPTWNQASPFATGLGYKNRVYTWTSSSGTITF
jgi:hypothetical protein